MTHSKPPITGTKHVLPFDKLSPLDFERLCLWLVEREGYERAEHLGASGSEQGRDIIAWREGKLWAFQCKRVQRFGPKSALAEADKVLALPQTERPMGLMFIVTCDVSANTRRQVRTRCGSDIECRFWTGSELDAKVKKHSDILEEFFDLDRGESLRDKELAYLDDLLKRYEYWLDHYTPLAGIAEVRAAVKDGPRLDLPMPFVPAGFEKLVEHGYGPQMEVRREPLEDLRDAVAEHKRIILLGAPGSGKTTTLWRLAYDYATAAREDVQAPLPVFVSLGGYTDDGPFDAYLARHLGPIVLYLDTYRASGRLILLLDGLNEMPQAGYAERAGQIRDSLDRYPDEAVVVTCRALDYVEKLEQLQRIEISPLDETRIRMFLHNYLGEKVGERLFSAVGGRAERWPWEELPPLLAIGRNPYLLLMTAQVYASEGELPANRARLLGAFVDTLMGREKKRHPQEWIKAESQKDGLAALAYAMQAERGTTVEREWTVAQLSQAVLDYDAEMLLYLATSATLLDADDATVRFYHQMLEEYFAARHIVSNVGKGTLPSLLAHCTDYHWRQVILLTASLLDNADIFFYHFLQVLNGLVKDDENLVTFLSWATRKASIVDVNYNLTAIRSYYCYSALILPFVRTSPLFFPFLRTGGLDFGPDFDIARLFDFEPARACDLIGALDLDLVRDLNPDLGFGFGPDRDLNFDPDRVCDLDLRLDHTLLRALIGIDRDFDLDLCQQLGLHALHQALSIVTFPPQGASTETWNAFVNDLQAITTEHRDIGHSWDFTEKQFQCLERYFYAAELLVQCLNLAVVTDRPAIENRLLLPPGIKDTTVEN